MTVIRPNSISGVTSITALANEINVFKHDGVLAGLQLNGVNHHTSSGVSTFHTLNVLGNVSVGGTLTYQDVTNVDSLGIGTFRTGINVSGHTELDNVNIAGVTTFANTARFSGGDVIFSGTNNFLQWDKSADYLRFMDGIDATFGNSDDLKIYHNGSNSYIKNDTGWLNLLSDTIFLGNNADTKAYLKGYNGGSVEIFYNHSKKFETTNTGAVVTGILTATSFSGDGSNLTGITGTTINNNANNRLITGSGTANTLEGEANLTYDGNTVRINHTALTANGDADDLVIGNLSQSSGITIASGTNLFGTIFFADTSTSGAGNRMGAIRYNHNSDHLEFNTGGNNQRVVIKSDGEVNFNSDAVFTNSTWTGNKAGKIQHHSNWLYLQAGTSGIKLRSSDGSDETLFSGRKIDIEGGRNSSDDALVVHMEDNRYRKIQLAEATVSHAVGTYGGFIGYDASNNYMTLGTNQAGTVHEGMRFHRSGGYVTKPSQPKFSAYMANTYSWNNQIIVWDSELYDIGNHYNTGNGKFTAPVAGYYVFGVKFRAGTGFGQFGGMWTKNSSTYKRAFGQNSYAQGDCITAVDVIPMSANDTMGLRFEGSHGGATGGAHENGFWGYLLG